MRIAILGGTGPEGMGLAARLASIGEAVVLGSRSAERAEEAARSLREKVPAGDFAGAPNAEAAAGADLVVLTVPWDGLTATLQACADALAGKIVVDTVVPLAVDKGFFGLKPVPEGSVGQHVQALLPSARVVSAFKHQSAHELLAVERPVEGDVLLCGDDAAAKTEVAALVGRIAALRPVDTGDARGAHVLEAMTALLLNVNKRYKTRSSVRLLGV